MRAEVVESVSADLEKVMDCSQINLGMELNAEIVRNAKRLNGSQLASHQHPPLRQIFNHIIVPIVVMAVGKVAARRRPEPVDAMITDLSGAQPVANNSCAKRSRQHLSSKAYSKYGVSAPGVEFDPTQQRQSIPVGSFRDCLRASEDNHMLWDLLRRELNEFAVGYERIAQSIRRQQRRYDTRVPLVCVVDHHDRGRVDCHEAPVTCPCNGFYSFLPR